MAQADGVDRMEAAVTALRHDAGAAHTVGCTAGDNPPHIWKQWAIHLGGPFLFSVLDDHDVGARSLVCGEISPSYPASNAFGHSQIEPVRINAKCDRCHIP